MEHNSDKKTAEITDFLDTDMLEKNLLSLEGRGNMPPTGASAQPDTSIDQPAGKRCYTVEDLQVMLSCSRETVYSLLAKHEFRWFRLGGKRGPYRIFRNSFDEWLDQMNQ